MDSARVRLEVALLESATVPALAPPPANDGLPRLTALVVAVEADVRQYVRECLRHRADLRVVEAATVAEALAQAANEPPQFLVVDAPQCDLLVALPQLRAIVIVDDGPRRERPPGARVRFLDRPFSAGALAEEVDRLLGV